MLLPDTNENSRKDIALGDATGNARSTGETELIVFFSIYRWVSFSTNLILIFSNIFLRVVVHQGSTVTRAPSLSKYRKKGKRIAGDRGCQIHATSERKNF